MLDFLLEKNIISNNINDLFNIKYISGCYINTKDNEISIVIELLNMKNEDSYNTFYSLINSIDLDLKFIVLKKFQKFEIYEKYFEEILENNINTKNLSHVLLYIKNFKNIVENLNSYKIYLMVTTPDRTFKADSIMKVMDKLDLEYKIYYEKEIVTLFNNLFIK